MRSGNSRRRAFLQRLRAEPRRIRDGTKARSGAFRQNAEARRPSAEAEAPAAAGAAHAAETPDGHTYVLVTAFADGTYAPVYDAIDIYRNYIPSPDAAEVGATDAGD